MKLDAHVVPVGASVFKTNSDGWATIEIAGPASIGELKATTAYTERAGALLQQSVDYVLPAAL